MATIKLSAAKATELAEKKLAELAVWRKKKAAEFVARQTVKKNKWRKFFRRPLLTEKQVDAQLAAGAEASTFALGFNDPAYHYWMIFNFWDWKQEDFCKNIIELATYGDPIEINEREMVELVGR